MGLRLAWAPIAMVALGGCLLDRSTGGLLPPDPGAGGNGGNGGAVACTAGADCPPASGPCQQPACNDGVCGFALLPDAAPCNDTGQCFEGTCLAGLGQPCTIDDGCFGAVCVEGLCCEAACDEVCFSCSLAGLEGSCLPAAATSVDDDCDTTCDGLGQCAQGELVWGQAWGSTFTDEGMAIGVDEDGFGYVAVEHDNTLPIGGMSYSSSLTDAVVARLDPMGEVQWVHELNGNLDEDVEDLAVTSDGGVVVAGRFSGDLDGFSASGSDDGYLRKLDAMGQELWTHRLGGTGFSGVYAVDAHATEDSVAAGGFFSSAVDFGNDAVSSMGGFEGFVQRLGPGLIPQWRYVLAGSGDASVQGLEFEGDELWLGGSFTAALQLDETLNANAFDVYVAKLSATGQPVMSAKFGAIGNQFLWDLALLPDGAIVLVGSYDGSFESAVGLPQASGTDAFVMVIEPSGDLRWATSFNATTYEVVARTVDVDAAGNIVIGGSFAGPTSFGGDLVNAPQPGLRDGFVVKLAADGTYYWHRTFGAGGNDNVWSVATGPTGAVHVTGYFDDGIAFGPTLTLDVGIIDAFALQLTP